MNSKATIILILFLSCLQASLRAQGFNDYDQNQLGEGGSFAAGGYAERENMIDANGRSIWGRDTSKVDKTVPTEFFQWYVDDFGAMERQEYNDTLPHLFQDFNATDGMTGEYSHLGNLGSPRMPFNVLDREVIEDFMFLYPFDMFHTTPGNLLFTNTKSPLTNLQYHESGNKENGQDRLRAYFASNINKQAGIGFKIDYLYGRGYYNNQANSQFGGSIFGYYQGERYDLHAMASWEHMKMGENGGIEDDRYITDPQSFTQSYGSRDIPTRLASVWNRNNSQTYSLKHRYHVGFMRELEVPDSLKPQMPADAELLKRLASDSLRTVVQADSLRLIATLDTLRRQWQNEQVAPQEFVPVTSFIHTLKLERLQHANYLRTSMSDSYFGHAPYYGSTYDNITDESRIYDLTNTFAVQLREGFNKWAQASITLFGRHALQRFDLPSATTTDEAKFYDRFTENHISIGGRIQRTQGHTLHYNAGAELWMVGGKRGDFELSGEADLNFRLGRDTVRFEASAAVSNAYPSFFFEHFQSQTTWWDNKLDREQRVRLEGKLTLDRTHTSLRFGVMNFSNYAYFTATQTPILADDGTVTGYSYGTAVNQHSAGIQVMSATLRQELSAGIFHWDNEVTWQTSSDDKVLPLPALTVWSNPYIVFPVARVLRVELGGELRYFTNYYAPTWAPFVGAFAVQDASQDRLMVGNYPVINAYANLAIKRVRMYVNATHVNASHGRAFWAPHYPMDPMSIRIGISWNFYN